MCACVRARPCFCIMYFVAPVAALHLLHTVFVRMSVLISVSTQLPQFCAASMASPGSVPGTRKYTPPFYYETRIIFRNLRHARFSSQFE